MFFGDINQEFKALKYMKKQEIFLNFEILDTVYFENNYSLIVPLVIPIK